MNEKQKQSIRHTNKFMKNEKIKYLEDQKKCEKSLFSHY